MPTEVRPARVVGSRDYGLAMASHPVSLDENAVVIRFRPTQAEAVLRSAQKEFRRVGHYGCSVYAGVPRDGESQEDVVRRVLQSADLAGMTVRSGNKKAFVCARASRIEEQGFAFLKDGDDDELDDHYCVNLGNEPDEADAQRFVDQFDEEFDRRVKR